MTNVIYRHIEKKIRLVHYDTYRCVSNRDDFVCFSVT